MSLKNMIEREFMENMQKSAFVFDGRNILDIDMLEKIGSVCYAIGKGWEMILCKNIMSHKHDLIY